ncbi:ribosome biogenesis GTPase YlqF [Pasteuria penetrans]|uniref:ribosome biogenesis GTPase YlqF n=1 Tax=Pasteuria penetrans TaxID=86005 RepID=UPI000FAF0650|nr:ribosome biogenesis GTPase YlqF [Pasteuria penetrans]
MIQWFPGHMARARRQIESQLGRVDLVWEIADARLPQASRNPLLDELCQHKPRLVIINKTNLADPVVTQQWLKYFPQRVVTMDVQSGKGVTSAVETSRRWVRSLRQSTRWGSLQRGIRAMVVGIPNVGKSSLINRLARRSSSATGKLPGVTRAQQWIRVHDELLLLDTPGLLWPSFSKPSLGKVLAATGTIRDALFPPEGVAVFLLRCLYRTYPQVVRDRYGGKFSDLPRHAWLSHIGRQRGCLRAGGVVDTERAAAAVLSDFRYGKLGRVTLQRPPSMLQGGETFPPSYHP